MMTANHLERVHSVRVALLDCADKLETGAPISRHVLTSLLIAANTALDPDCNGDDYNEAATVLATFRRVG